MEAYLIENESVLSLDDLSAEVRLSEVEVLGGGAAKSGDGRIDLLVLYGDDPMEKCIGIVELKNLELTEMHLSQLEGYLDAKESILKRMKDDPEFDDEEKKYMDQWGWIGVLSGPSIDSELAEKITSGYTYSADTHQIPVAAITIQRFLGEDGSVYVTTDQYFQRSIGKDMTRFVVNGGEPMRKSRLVHHVVKDYVSKHPEITLAELRQAFPDEIQGKNFGIIQTEEAAREKSKKYSRYFLNPDEIIGLKDARVAVCNQWGGIGDKGNFPNFLKLVQQSKVLSEKYKIKAAK